MLHSALAISNDDLVMIALWNGEVGDGTGGTQTGVAPGADRCVYTAITGFRAKMGEDFSITEDE